MGVARRFARLGEGWRLGEREGVEDKFEEGFRIKIGWAKLRIYLATWI